MGMDVRKQCAVCAWRDGCTKKHRIKETALHCPDFCRDRTLATEPAPVGGPERHKQLVDVFGDKGR